MNPEKVARDRVFEREALPWIDDVYRFALSLTHDAVDAEDVVQDTFLRAYKSWHTYVPGSDCRRWLFTICRNVFLRSLERRSDLMNPEKVARDRVFEREALPWIDDVYRFALSLTHDAVDAEDVVQDTFLRAYKSWHTYVPGSDCRRWLFTICRNVFLRSLERRSDR